MDQIKIGRFIAERRKMQNLTQAQLAEKLNITDRAISKWETGRSLPDSTIMLELCDILQISIIDLFNGEVVIMNEQNERLEKMLLEMTAEKEKADKQLLRIEIFIGVLGIAIFLGLCAVSVFVKMDSWLRAVLVAIGVIIVFICSFVALRIEQVAGFYQCGKCGHKYVPTYKAVTMAPHICRTRYMKCPCCGKRSWNKKVINKD